MLEALIEQHEGAMEACTTIEQEGQILLDYLTLVKKIDIIQNENLVY